MLRRWVTAWRSWNRSWMAALVTATLIGLLAVVPAPLLPVARGWRDLCEQYPVLALVTGHLEPLPVALLVSLVALGLVNGGRAGMPRLFSTLRFNRQLGRHARPLPPRLDRVAGRLDLTDRLTYLEYPGLAVCCYGFVRPRVAITAGLLASLDDDELAAVLAHERHHLQRRDPARYLALHTLTAAAFMFPVTPAVRQRLEARVELAADRAALAVAPRGALAGALLAVLGSTETAFVGAVGLSPTEARIAHLAGTPAVPPIPFKATVASLALLALIVLAVIDLTTSAHLVQMACRFCSDVM